MAYLILNELSIIGDDVDEIRDFMQSDKSAFDFTHVLPIPKDLVIESGPITIGVWDAVKTLPAKDLNIQSLLKAHPEFSYGDVRLGMQLYRNYCLYRVNDWHDWCSENWGTEWNAVDAEWLSENRVCFKTVERTPMKFIQELSWQFPDALFEVEYFDDIGYYLDSYAFHAGELEYGIWK